MSKEAISEQFEEYMKKAKVIPIKDVRQIAYEVALWAQDVQETEKCKKLLKIPIKETFKDKFDKWIENRIKMVIDRK